LPCPPRIPKIRIVRLLPCTPSNYSYHSCHFWAAKKSKWTSQEDITLTNGGRKFIEVGGSQIFNEKNFGGTSRHRDKVATKDKWRCNAGTVQITTSSTKEEGLIGDSPAKNSNCSTAPIINNPQASTHLSSFTLESWLKTALHENVRDLSLTNVRYDVASIVKHLSLFIMFSLCLFLLNAQKDMEALCLLPAFQHIYHRYCHIEARFQQLLSHVSNKHDSSTHSNRSNSTIATNYYEPKQQELQSLQQGDEDVHTHDFLDMHNPKEHHPITGRVEGCIPNILDGRNISFHSSAAEEESTKTVKQPVSHYLLDTPRHRGKRDRVIRKSFP
jgi:hypothetical protein